MQLFYYLGVSGNKGWAQELLQKYRQTIEQPTLKHAIFKLEMKDITPVQEGSLRMIILNLIGIPIYTKITKKAEETDDIYIARIADEVKVPTIETVIRDFDNIFPNTGYNKYLKVKEKYIKLKQLLS